MRGSRDALVNLITQDDKEGLLMFMSSKQEMPVDELKVLLEIAIQQRNFSVFSMIIQQLEERHPGWKGELFQGATALGRAVQRGDESMVRVLLKFVDPDESFVIQQELWTPLSFAVDKKHSSIVKLLLKHNVDVNAKDPSNVTPLCKALQKKLKLICNDLLESGRVDVEAGVFSGDGDKIKFSPLALAIQTGDLDFVEMLLQKGGADPTAQFGNKHLDYLDNNPLQYSLILRNLDVAMLLFDYIRNENQVKEMLCNLHYVDLSGLGLDFLPVWLKHLPDDVELKIGGNPLSMLPQSVKQQGASGVLRYLRDVDDEKKRVKWNRAKVMVLGREGVGKTQLYHLMRGEKKSPRGNVSTNGIDIHRFMFNDDMELTWFDFGGQEVFYPTHQFFLTSHCVYLIVFRMDNAEYLDRVRYWLDVLRSVCAVDQLQIIVVGTHQDMVKADQEKEIWEKLEPLMRECGVMGHIGVNCKTGKNVSGVRKGISLAFETAKFGVMDVPR